MSDDKKKLESVKLISKAEQKELLLRLNKVKIINQDRKKLFDKLSLKQQQLEQEIYKLENHDKNSSLIKGDISQVVNLNQRIKQKNNILHEKMKELEEVKKSYLRSNKRLKEVEQSILDNKVDQKKYDKIIEKSKITTERLMKEIEDINSEDLLRNK